MSQLDLIAELRAHRPVAPAELRERVRQLAADAPAPRRHFTWRRALVVAIAVAGLAAVAGVLGTRDGGRRTSAAQQDGDIAGSVKRVYAGTPSTEATDSLGAADHAAAAPTLKAATGESHRAATGSALGRVNVPPPSGTNAQRYSATLTLRLKDSAAVSAATNKALRIASAMGGHPTTVNVDAERKDGEAYLVLKVPRSRVQEAVQKLGALGTIVAANVSIQDLQAGIDTTARTIDRLQGQLAELREQTQTEDVVAQVETLSNRIENLQRQRAATIRAAYFATVKLHMETPAKPVAPAAEESGNGPLHGLGVAFRWIGIGAVYVLALGTPLVLLLALAWLLARVMRRRREEALLGRA